jgi:hypothetical protein
VEKEEERWRMERWNDGILEYWNDGFMGKIENILKMLKWDNE